MNTINALKTELVEMFIQHDNSPLENEVYFNAAYAPINSYEDIRKAVEYTDDKNNFTYMCRSNDYAVEMLNMLEAYSSDMQIIRRKTANLFFECLSPTGKTKGLMTNNR